MGGVVGADDVLQIRAAVGSLTIAMIAIVSLIMLKQKRNALERRVAELSRLLAERKITLELTEAAKEFLGNEGFDPVYGARPLKRAIQRRILDPLSLELLEGHFRDGDTILAGLLMCLGNFDFSKADAPAEAVPATA